MSMLHARGFLTRAVLLVTATAMPLLVSLAQAQDPALPAADQGKLVITTVPDGATLLLDESAVGISPLELSVPPGRHLIRATKKGFIQRTHVVEVSADRTATVDLRLVPDEAPSAAAPARVRAHRPRAALVATGAAVGTGLFLLFGNSAPEPGAILALPAGTGLMGATIFTFAAPAASDAENDPLTFTWDFGDETTGMGQVTTHTYSTEGTFTVGLTVADSHGRKGVAPTTTVSVRGLTGRWRLTFSDSWSAPQIWSLTQTGTAIVGTRQYVGYTYSYPVRGQVLDPRRVLFDSGLAGEADARVTEISGVEYGSTTFRLVRQ